MASRFSVLLISSRPEVAEAFRRDPKSARYILTVRSPKRIDIEEASHNYQCVLIDSAGLSDPVAMGRELRSHNPQVEFILIVSRDTESVGLDALKYGAFDYHVWPSDAKVLWMLLSRCLDRCQPPEQVRLGPFGPYRLIRRIAKGGMAEVYLAEPTDPGSNLPSPLVLKRIRAAFAEKPEFVTMFMDEARISALLRHSNVVRLLDFGRAQGLLYMAMEYVPGTNLFELIRAVKRLQPGLAAHIVAQAADALDYVHSLTDDLGQPLNVLHRDVSPANILLSTDGAVKLADFGIAKAAQRYAETTLGAVKGKADYMSPEQVRQERNIDARSDLFALGIILYELVMGQHPFRGAAPVDTLTNIREGRFVPTSAADTVDVQLQRIMAKALANQPAHRYAGAAQLARDLREWSKNRPSVGAFELRQCVEKTLQPSS